MRLLINSDGKYILNHDCHSRKYHNRNTHMKQLFVRVFTQFYIFFPFCHVAINTMQDIIISLTTKLDETVRIGDLARASKLPVEGTLENLPILAEVPKVQRRLPVSGISQAKGRSVQFSNTHVHLVFRTP